MSEVPIKEADINGVTGPKHGRIREVFRPHGGRHGRSRFGGEQPRVGLPAGQNEPEQAVKPFRQQPHEKEIVKTAENLAEYKGQYMDTVKDLVGKGLLPQAIGDRIPIVSSIPILLDPGRTTHNASLKDGAIFIDPAFSDLILDHEMTHLPLVPGVSWQALNEGRTQARALLINANMPHPENPDKQQFYTAHVQLDYEIRRLTGLSENEMDELFTNPSSGY